MNDIIDTIVVMYLMIVEDYINNFNNPSCIAAEKIINNINRSKNYRIGYFHYKNPEYGFLDGNVFCSAKFIKKDLLLFKNELCICKISEGPKGLRANKIELFNYNGCKAIMNDYFEKFYELIEKSWYKAYQEEKERIEAITKENEAYRLKKAAEKAAAEEKIKMICGSYRESNYRNDNKYGGHYESRFFFEKEISEEEFKEVLLLLHHKVETKKTNLPIREEIIEIKGGGTEWFYTWIGEWDD